MEKVFLNLKCPCGVRGSMVVERTLKCLSCESIFKVELSEEGRPAIILLCKSHDLYRWPVYVCKIYTDTNEITEWESPHELQPRQFIRGYLYALNKLPLDKLVLFASRLQSEEDIHYLLSGWVVGAKQSKEELDDHKFTRSVGNWSSHRVV